MAKNVKEFVVVTNIMNYLAQFAVANRNLRKNVSTANKLL